MSAGDPEATRYAQEKSTRMMGVAALRRLRRMVDRETHTEAEVRRFTVRALLWLAVVALSVPLAMFCIGATQALMEHQSRGRPMNAFLSRLLAEGLGMLWWLVPWALAMWALVRTHQGARGVKKT